MKNKLFKKIVVFLIGVILLFLSIYNNGEKFVKDTGSMICLECIGLAGRIRQMHKNRW